MKKFFPIFALIAACTFSISAQQPENQVCPKINIISPSGLPDFDKPLTFTLEIGKEAERYDLTYFWSVNNDGLIEGQGTSEIKVTWKETCNKSNIASVDIKGLPDSCPNTFSEMFSIACCYIEPRLIDDFSLSAQRIDKARLDYFITELQNEPTAQGYIIEKFPPQTSKQVIDRKIKLIRDYLVKIRRQDISRFTFVTSEDNRNTTQFWLVPAGTMPPTP